MIENIKAVGRPEDSISVFRGLITTHSISKAKKATDLKKNYYATRLMKFEFLPKNDKNVPWAKHFQMFPGFDTMNRKK